MSSAPISQDQWDHMLETWRIFDADGDGLITSQDLKTVLLSFGYEHSIEDLDEYLDKLPLCIERDGSLDLPEFILWIKKLAEQVNIEGKDRAIKEEEEFEARIPKQNSRKTLQMKEKISNTRLNRLALEELLDDEQDQNDRDLFKKIDVEDNGFITYQDIQHMSEDLGELWKFEDLDEMTFAIADRGTVRRVLPDKFVEVINTQIAWDEKDLLPCQQQLLESQAEFRRAEAERLGLKVKRENQKNKPPPPMFEAKKYCSIM